MIRKTEHICKCGQVAVARESVTGDWFCLRCALDAMLEYGRRGDSVSASFGESRISDVLIVPGDNSDGDLLAHLAEAVPISVCRN